MKKALFLRLAYAAQMFSLLVYAVLALAILISSHQPLRAEISPQPENKNLLFAPFSFIQAMTYTYVGTGGETKAQMEALVNPLKVSDQLLINKLQAKVNLLKPLCSCATAFFIDSRLPVHDSYTKLLPEGSCQLVNFQNSSAAVLQMNGWAREATSDKIKELLQPSDVDSSTIACLLSTLHFKAAWARPFSRKNSYQGVFYTASGALDVTYMQQVDRFQFAEDADFIFLVLPYEDPIGENGGEDRAKFVMELLLPKSKIGESIGFKKARETLAPQLVTGSDGHTKAPLEMRLLEVHLPKFTIRNRLDLKPVLEVMGITLPFTDSADFSALSPAPLKIQKVLQEAVLEVSEEGCEGAAATAVSFALRSILDTKIERVVKFDRPFYLRIIEAKSGAEIFQATVRQPTA